MAEKKKDMTARTFKDATKKVFKLLEKSYHFDVIDVEYGDGYFVFAFGKNSVVHFHVKQMKGWKCALWWDKDEDTGEIKAEWFAQWEKSIDKFKPSCSVWKSIIEPVKSVKEIDECSIYDITDQMNFIRNHKYLAWWRDFWGGDFNTT